jgi:hypothetical protein
MRPVARHAGLDRRRSDGMLAPRERGIELGVTGPQLFLSHSSADAKLVSQLAQDLNICGVDVWLDAWELRVGDDLHDRIANAIAKAKFVAVVVSGRFDQSKWMRGEVSQALSREKAEARTVVLPLLLDDAPLPPLLGSKKFLNFTPAQYFPSLARLVGLTHGLDTQAVEAGIGEIEPDSVRGSIAALRFAGFEPYCVVDTKTLDVIARAGGHVSGNMVRFDPERVLQDPHLSPALRQLVRRLITAW